MQVSVISFTRNGLELSEKIEKSFIDWQIKLYTKYKLEVLEGSSQIIYVSQGISEWAGEQMGQKNVLVFIGACGIAVRAISTYVKDKLQDSPVLVMDEQGRYVIPLLSGHVGGANEIANILAERLQATPVITTATDVNRRFAVDLFAKKNGLRIVNKDGIAKISSKILDGKTITIAIEEEHWNRADGVPEQREVVDLSSGKKVDMVIVTDIYENGAELILNPKEYILGIGCKRGMEEEKLTAWIQKNLAEVGISMEQVYAMASIDRKKDEEGLLRISQREGIPFLTYSAEELERVTGSLHESEFVKKTVGVSNVCERAALYACGEEGRLVYEKHAEDGMTIAVAKRKWSVLFDEN